MASFLLTWVPDKWAWSDLSDQVEALERGEPVPGRWSVGHRTEISPGDRLFLLRQGREPRGIMASGFADSKLYESKHWDPKKVDLGKPAFFVHLHFDVLVDPEQNPDGVLGLDELRSGVAEERRSSLRSQRCRC